MNGFLRIHGETVTTLDMKRFTSIEKLRKAQIPAVEGQMWRRGWIERITLLSKNVLKFR